MTSETRRRFAALLAGMAGAFVTLSVSLWLRQDACLDAGGRWVAAVRVCDLPAGTPASSPVRFYIVGAAVGVLVAAVLWRTFTFIAHRAAARRSGVR